MNKQRRKVLDDIKERIQSIRDELELVGGEEEDYYENMPENLQYSSRGEKAQEAVEALEEAVSNLEDAIDNIDLAME